MNSQQWESVREQEEERGRIEDLLEDFTSIYEIIQ